MTCYSVIAVTPITTDWMPAYLGVVAGLVAKHGGTYLARTASHERLEGDGEEAALRVLLQWPSKEAALAFMGDPEYAPHLQARAAGSVSHHVLIEGEDDLA
jgi:uncharacterized protein (DUF1330 family)